MELFKKNQNSFFSPRVAKPVSKKCKVKIKLNQQGKMIGYESENCSKEEIKAVVSKEPRDEPGNY